MDTSAIYAIGPHCRQLYLRVHNPLQRPARENGALGAKPKSPSGTSPPGYDHNNGTGQEETAHVIQEEAHPVEAEAQVPIQQEEESRQEEDPPPRTPPQQSGGARNVQLTHGHLSTAQESHFQCLSYHPTTRLTASSTCSRCKKTGSTSRPLRLPPGEEVHSVTG